jgi:hypothetical protein
MNMFAPNTQWKWGPMKWALENCLAANPYRAVERFA